MPDFSPDDVRTLGAKLDALTLAPGERAVLDRLLSTVGEAEVEGFAMPAVPDRLASPFAIGGQIPISQSLSRAFKVEIEGFTAPGDVARRPR